MRHIFQLNAFEEFELWLKGLLAHMEEAAVLPGLSRSPAADRSRHEELRTTLRTVQDLIRLSHGVLAPERMLLQELETSQPPTDSESKDEVDRLRQDCARCVGEFEGFVSMLTKSTTLCRSLLRLADVSREEYEALNHFIDSEIAEFRKGESYAYLRRKSYNWKIHSVIHSHLLAEVQTDLLKREVENAFARLMQVMTLISYIQGSIRRGLEPSRLIILMTQCYLICRELFTLLEDAARHFEGHRPDLADAFRGTRSALQMEAGKIFKVELRDIDVEQKLEDVHRRVERSMGMLHNAFEGSVDYLIHLLNPKFELFVDEPRRFKESISLLTDLKHLNQLLQQAGNPVSTDEWSRIRQSILRFRENSMKALFAADRKPFEQFAEEIEYTEPSARSFVIHRFQVFVAALIGQVQNRTIFARPESGGSEADLEKVL